MKLNRTTVIVVIGTILIVPLAISFFNRQQFLIKSVLSQNSFFTSYFLKLGADPYLVDENYKKSAIFMVIDTVENEKSIKILDKIIHGQENLETYSNDSLEANPISMAIYQNKRIYIDILAKKCDINKQNKNGLNPIFYARDDLDMIKFLVQKNAKISNVDSEGNNLFHYYPTYKLLSYLNKEFPNVINEKNNEGYTPLIVSILEGNLTHTANLLKLGANPEIKDNEGFTPLSIAAQKGNTANAKFLIESGANINQKNNDGSTPLFYAEAPRMVSFLTKRGASIYEEDNEGNTVFHKIENPISFEMLLNLADLAMIEKPNTKGITPLMKAVASGNEVKALKLLKNISTCSSELLAIAEQSGNKAIINTVRSKTIFTAERAITRDALAIGARRVVGRRILGKLLTRGIPILGWILFAKDIIDLTSE